jgi:hypothetical protein
MSSAAGCCFSSVRFMTPDRSYEMLFIAQALMRMPMLF